MLSSYPPFLNCCEQCGKQIDVSTAAFVMGGSRLCEVCQIHRLGSVNVSLPWDHLGVSARPADLIETSAFFSLRPEVTTPRWDHLGVSARPADLIGASAFFSLRSEVTTPPWDHLGVSARPAGLIETSALSGLSVDAWPLVTSLNDPPPALSPAGLHAYNVIPPFMRGIDVDADRLYQAWPLVASLNDPSPALSSAGLHAYNVIPPFMRGIDVATKPLDVVGILREDVDRLSQEIADLTRDKESGLVSDSLNPRVREVLRSEYPTSWNELNEAGLDFERVFRPDLTGAMSHAIAALECLLRSLLGEEKGTLGDLLKKRSKLAQLGLLGTHIKELEGVWGRSQVARHIKEGTKLENKDVRLIIRTVIGYVEFFLS